VLAKAVLFLASDDSSFVIAENLVVDDGFSLLERAPTEGAHEESSHPHPRK
jgi:hypothetical protein